MTWSSLRRLSLTGNRSKPSLSSTTTANSSSQIDLRLATSPPSPILTHINERGHASGGTPPASPRSPSPPHSRPATPGEDTHIKRSDRRFRRLSVVLSKLPGGKRLSIERSAIDHPPKIVAVTPVFEPVSATPGPCYVEVEDIQVSNGPKGVRRNSKVEQVDTSLFKFAEQQHATDKMVKAFQMLKSTPDIAEESEESDESDEASTEEDIENELNGLSSAWIKSTISVFSVNTPREFEALYEILQPLGSGSFSTVYLAKRRLDGVSFAVKKILKSTLNGKEDLIRAEIDIHSALDHPNIVKVIEVFETPEEWNIILQLAPGGELFTTLAENGALGERRGKEVAKSILRAVAFFHKKNVVHRDLKPENILLPEEDSNNVLVADFGLSALLPQGELLTKQCGSLEYAAPEVLRGKTGYDTKADMWSVGVIIYILLCGYQPFQDHDDSRVIRLILAGIYEFHASRWCFISQEAKDLVSKLLQVDPAKRLSAAEALRHPWFN